MKVVNSVVMLAMGAALGVGVMYGVNQASMTEFNSESGNATGEAKPLYWVAPMDPNYRRNEPGKSPMGMELVPVYAEGNDAKGGGPGAISISPEVVNNLGVRTAKVKREQLSPDVRTVGYLQYNKESITHIHPRVEGWIEKSFINTTGDPVEKGQALYDLYSPELVNAQEELLFGLKRKDVRLAQAAEYRLKSLQVSDNFIKKLKKSRQVSQTVRFFAPVSGVADSVSIQDGYFVKPGMTLLSINNLDQIWVEAEVFERQASLIKEGLPVEVKMDFLPGRPLLGTVDYVYPTLDSKTRTLRVRVRLANLDHKLKPNMFAELKIVAVDDQQRLLIPNEALIRGSEQDRVVLALGEGRYKSIEVKKGLRDSKHTEILEGLYEGEEVVTSAQFLIDSESSKASDFKRMHQVGETENKPNQVWVEVVFNSVDADEMQVNVDHAAIEDWQWPQMTMDFQLSPYLEMDGIKAGVLAHAQITHDKQNQYIITEIHISDQENEEDDSNTPKTATNRQKNSSMENSKSESKPTSSVWVKATVNSVDAEAVKLNVKHDAIPEWQWPQMVMDFQISEWVVLDELPTGSPLHLEVSRNEQGGYEITDFYLPESE
ncbi:efflux RND transporter periplasmic adaptor subunit [Neptuniibacter marinus]|uniref:efflux RND transporter periplasmic adaptor subunit n=1 Tax=Neptuniibacter marinus TaxID=1806670 RepID=UPI000946CEA7|nr:efflux RND transporter periplasmic adaptor subunit [Neptuniibacter marinus]